MTKTIFLHTALFRILVQLYIMFAIGLMAIAPISAADKSVIGRSETISLEHTDFMIRAKIDTGADTTSIHVDSVQTVHINGEDWVDIVIQNKQNNHLKLRKKVLYTTKIKRHQAASLERPVVELSLCIGNKLFRAPVNLSNRRKYRYAMLIGRNILKGNFVVDVDKINVLAPQCDLNTKQSG